MGWTVYNSDGKILQSAELGDNAVTSAKIADGAILNADINASAAIAKTKLASLDVVNADVNASAAVAYSKLAALADGNILVGNGSNVATSVNPSGDVDIANDGTFSIASGVLVNADVNASAAVALSKLATTTVSRALVSNGSGVISPSAVTSTEIGYLDGVTSAIQTQIDNAGGAALTGSTNNTIVTVTGADTIQGEASLTFDGTTLTIPGQITFPASVSLSSNANTLDDYQEGVFTPVFQDWSFSNSEGQSYTTQVGRYVKIGRWVTVQIYLACNLASSTLADGSQSLIAGLPFASSTGTGFNYALSCSYLYGMSGSSPYPVGRNVTGMVNANTSYVVLSMWSHWTGVQPLNFSMIDDHALSLVLTGQYETDA
jgi:hypothetical protein